MKKSSLVVGSCGEHEVTGDHDELAAVNRLKGYATPVELDHRRLYTPYLLAGTGSSAHASAFGGFYTPYLPASRSVRKADIANPRLRVVFMIRRLASGDGPRARWHCTHRAVGSEVTPTLLGISKTRRPSPGLCVPAILVAPLFRHRAFRHFTLSGD